MATTETATKTNHGIHRRNHMWLSPAKAVLIFDVANWALIGALVVGVIATFLVVWMGSVKEEYANKEIAELSARGAEAMAEAAKANAEVAKAKLETQRLKEHLAWRRLTLEQAQILISLLKGRDISLRLDWVDTDPESTQFADDIYKALESAGVKLSVFHGYERAVGFAISAGETENGKVLREAFSSIGLPLIDWADPSMKNPKNEIRILVGTKAPTF